MAFVIKPGKYLIEKSRRRVIGVIAWVGTGGSIPKPVQAVLNDYKRSLAQGHRGADAATIREIEGESIASTMKSMQGALVILSPSGLRWSHAGADINATKKALKTALKNSGWNPPDEHLDDLLWGPPPF
jgi:hypothetical protein